MAENIWLSSQKGRIGCGSLIVLIIIFFQFSSINETPKLFAQTASHTQITQESQNVSTKPWQNVCPSPDVIYCEDIGKIAYEAFGPLAGTKLGRIIGVAWRPKGALISLPGSLIRVSPRNAYYYIIDDGTKGAPPFLRQCREISVR